MWPEDIKRSNNLKDLYKRFNIYERDITNFEKVFLKENEYILIDNAEQELHSWRNHLPTAYDVTVVKVTRITI